MKKIFALILAVMMIATMSTTAFAATVEEEKTETITVTGTYDANTPADVISLDISWGSMAFTYTAGEQVWDPATHTYTTGEGSWSCDTDANKITMTNHSNIEVFIVMEFEAADGVNVTGKLYDQYGNECEQWGMAEADETGRLGTPANAHTDYALFNITGGAISANNDNLGTITLTISKTGR